MHLKIKHILLMHVFNVELTGSLGALFRNSGQWCNHTL